MIITRQAAALLQASYPMAIPRIRLSEARIKLSDALIVKNLSEVAVLNTSRNSASVFTLTPLSSLIVEPGVSVRVRYNCEFAKI